VLWVGGLAFNFTNFLARPEVAKVHRLRGYKLAQLTLSERREGRFTTKNIKG
ncbi:hypothetical protein CY34DRAFT_813528, partial [Suillus luteus UH-Slu-Lm8-n1]